MNGGSVAARPDDPSHFIARAEALLARGETSDAVDVLREALLRDHRHAPTLVAFSRAQLRWGNVAFAEEAARMALAEQPDDAAALAQLATLLIGDDRAAEALELLDAALAHRSGDLDAARLRARALKVLGRIEEARAALRALIAAAPSHVAALISLAEIERFAPGDALIDRLREAVAAIDPGDAHAPALHFALGRALDQIGDAESAFDAFSHGNSLTRQRVVYDEPSVLRMLARIPAVLTRDRMAARAPATAVARPMPVFIVGMPRSGSTLAEQILSRHGDVACSGEITGFSDALSQVRRAAPALPTYPDFVPLIAGETIAAVGADYRARVRRRAGEAPVHVDKLLGNFMFLGAIHMALPDARFIVMRRDPRDACLSSYSLLFDQRMPYSYDLGELGRYHAAFDRVMQHWLGVLPADCILEVTYEDLVVDIESEVRRMLAFLGLDWNPDCLRFHESRRPVLTASFEQVRQPLYASSVGRWRAYERHLGPLFQALGDA